ncbi:hypothetical protein B0H17DRAFT_1212144 [Mycena rosella]|uniref:Uncharacterized protein n=1 Tax=Mycena rosella TaxID=1033263 RepID=A0AAD7CTA7_MYCRO|nr:hypothetical protein B0H17DRAFT_1212144 [Mycena rosella]
MDCYVLQSLDVPGKPTPGSLSSLVFCVPFPDHAPRQFLDRYDALRTERQIQSQLEEACGRLALEAYLDKNIRAERERWTDQASSAFHDLVLANKSTLRHVELVLPTGGIATPLNLLSSLKEITNLESFCVQWPLRGYLPLTLMLMYQWAHIIEDSITPAFTDFHTDLIDVLSTHAVSLKCLRISLPQSTTYPPFSALSLNTQTFPALPALELLDLTHWSPSVGDLTNLLALGGPLPAVQHLIIDHGREIPATDFDGHDDGEEVGDDYDYDAPEIETHSWPALGAFLSARQLPLRSLSAALHDTRFSYGPASRLRQEKLRGLLGVEGLVVCTAWPACYDEEEPGGEDAEHEADLYAHAPGCGHLVYPPDQRPKTGLWPAEGEEMLAIQMIAGRPWY